MSTHNDATGFEIKTNVDSKGVFDNTQFEEFGATIAAQNPNSKKSKLIAAMQLAIAEQNFTDFMQIVSAFIAARAAQIRDMLEDYKAQAVAASNVGAAISSVPSKLMLDTKKALAFIRISNETLHEIAMVKEGLNTAKQSIEQQVAGAADEKLALERKITETEQRIAILEQKEIAFADSVPLPFNPELLTEEMLNAYPDLQEQVQNRFVPGRILSEQEQPSVEQPAGFYMEQEPSAPAWDAAAEETSDSNAPYNLFSLFEQWQRRQIDRLQELDNALQEKARLQEQLSSYREESSNAVTKCEKSSGFVEAIEELVKKLSELEKSIQQLIHEFSDRPTKEDPMHVGGVHISPNIFYYLDGVLNSGPSFFTVKCKDEEENKYLNVTFLPKT